MKHYAIQLSKTNNWDKSITLLPFKKWKGVVTFAYRLALVTGSKGRVTERDNGNGHYFAPSESAHYLSDLK